MSRDFTKSSLNNMSLGTATVNGLVSGAAAVSVHAWVNTDATDAGANDNRVLGVNIDGSSTGLALMVDGTGATRRVRVGGRSVIGDGFQARSGTAQAVALGTWCAIGGVLDIAGDVVTPYANGVADNGGAVTFANTTYTAGTPTVTDAIGAASTSGAISQPGQFDGRLAEVAVWNAALNAREFAALAVGTAALRVRAASLVFYMALWGLDSPERDLRSQATGTITGSLPQANHAPVQPFSRKLWVTATENGIPVGVQTPVLHSAARARASNY